eukprot:1320314-Prymnesium_polylepis.1
MSATREVRVPQVTPHTRYPKLRHTPRCCRPKSKTSQLIHCLPPPRRCQSTSAPQTPGRRATPPRSASSSS